MLTEFKSTIITSDNSRETKREFISLIGNDYSDDLLDQDNDINFASIKLLNGSIDIYQNNPKLASSLYLPNEEFSKNRGILALSFISDDIYEDHKKFQNMDLNVSEIKLSNNVDSHGRKLELAFFSISKRDSFDLSILIFENNSKILNKKMQFEEDNISKYNQVVIFSPKVEIIKELLNDKFGIRLALDKIFNFGDGEVRMLFFRIGGVTIEVVEDKKISSSTFGGIGWHSDNLRLCHKRLSKLDFTPSEIRKGRKPGTLVSTIKKTPVNIPTIIIGSDEH